MRHTKYFFFLIFLLSWLGHAQAQIEAEEVNRTPYGVVYNHLYYLQPDSYDPVLAARSFRGLPPAEAREAAILLKQVLDGKGMYIDIHRLPEQTNYVDSLSGEAIYYLDRHEPLIYLEKVDSAWFYSRTTVRAIPDLHKETYPFGTQLSTWFQAPAWQVGVLGIKLWQWLGLVLLLLASGLVFWILSRLMRPLVGRLAGLQARHMDALQKPLNRLARLIGLMITVKLVAYVLPILQLIPRLNAILVKALGVLFLFFVIFVVNQIVTIGFHYLKVAAKRTENTLDDQLLPVVMRVLRVIVWALGIIYILDFLGVNVTALLAGISLGGLALALAAQDTVKNFFGSIMIFIDKPFQIGDWIHFDDVDGVVEEVGVRSTRIRTFANSLTYVPNGYLANKTIDNMGLRVYRRFSTTISITYDTPPELINLFTEGIREIIRVHPTTRKDYFEVHLNSFGESALNILLYMFFAAPTWTDELRGRHDIMYAIIKLANDLGIRFAFPTQTLHIEELPSLGGSLTPKPLRPDEAAERRQDSLQGIKDYFTNREHDDQGKQKTFGGDG
ncbi:MAG: mechanosensitive ion channel family protein [Lewinella sp.]|nr:mechanosensitive ion channel family protein [Lewinella sp.]